METVKKQYKTTEKLESRMNIYDYSIATQSFSEWIAANFPKKSNVKILELGCGTGVLWKSLYRNFKKSDILLTDLSESMINKSKETLSNYDFNYAIVDYHQIPYNNDDFDIVISNHNLYHAESLEKVLKEIKHILKPKGIFSCTTNSENHLIEIKQLLQRFKTDFIWPNERLTKQFGLDTGNTILKKYFSNIEKRLHNNKLHILKPDAIVNYLLSVRDKNIHRIVNNNKNAIITEIDKNIKEKGFFEIQTEPGIFFCEK